MNAVGTIEAGNMGHAAALLRLAVPLAIVSLSEIAMGLTDTILLGGLGDRAVAAGGLSGTLFFAIGASLQGVLMAAGILAAQARGAGTPRRIAGLYGTGLCLGLVLSVPLFVLFSLAEPILRRLGEPAPLAHDVGTYLGILRWGTPAYVAGLGTVRAILPAIDQAGLLLRITPAMAIGNGLLNYALIYGVLGLPGLGLRGSAIASVATLWATVLALFACLHGSQRRELVTPPRPERRELAPLLRLGLPIMATIAGEVLMFLLASLAAGLLGTAALAAHQIVLGIGTFTFMVPMALGQAANVRVGLAAGAGDRVAARRGGLVAIGLAALVMGAIGLLLLCTPDLVASAFLDQSVPENRAAFRIVVTLLGILALFQVADGVQVAAIGALRGVGDTAMPMLLAQFAYWLVGLPLGWTLTFRLGYGAPGLWTALAVVLGTVAVMMTMRFALITRLGRTRKITR